MLIASTDNLLHSRLLKQSQPQILQRPGTLPTAEMAAKRSCPLRDPVRERRPRCVQVIRLRASKLRWKEFGNV